MYDITGEKLFYQKSEKVDVAAVTLDLDRGIYHENFNLDKRDKLLKEHPAGCRAGKVDEIGAVVCPQSQTAGSECSRTRNEYGLEELRHYLDSCRRAIDGRRGWQYEAKVLFPDLDVAGLKALNHRDSRAKIAGLSETAGQVTK